MNAVAALRVADFGFATARLLARPLGAGDADWFASLYGDAETMRQIGPPVRAARARHWFEGILAEGEGAATPRVFLALQAAGSERPLGLCALPRIEQARGWAEAGIVLTATARGAGLGREALAALLDVAWRRLPVGEICVQYAPGHARFERLAIGLGFEPRVAPDGFRHHRCMQIRSVTRASWFSRRHITKQGDDQCRR